MICTFINGYKSGLCVTCWNEGSEWNDQKSNSIFWILFNFDLHLNNLVQKSSALQSMYQKIWMLVLTCVGMTFLKLMTSISLNSFSFYFFRNLLFILLLFVYVFKWEVAWQIFAKFRKAQFFREIKSDKKPQKPNYDFSFVVIAIAQCGNCGNLLSPFLPKISWEQHSYYQLLSKEFISRKFGESKFFIFPHCPCVMI